MAKTILVVEDEPTLRETLAESLEADGYRAVQAADGRTAMEHFRADKPDLVLLDLIMPKLQGFEVLKALKADPATAMIPVVVLSNLGHDADVQRALESGAVAYLVKANLSLEELVVRARAALAG
jgi:DNA-binding response OmpR family regulator